MLGEPSSSSYAVDWTDQATWSLPPPKKPGTPACPRLPTPAATTATPEDHDTSQADTTADQPPPTPAMRRPRGILGHRRGDAPGQHDEPFFGYYLQAATIVNDEHGPEVPELARRMHLTTCHARPASRVRARP